MNFKWPVSKRWRGLLISVVAVIIAVWKLSPVIANRNEGFSVERISSAWSHNPDWTVPTLSDEERAELFSNLSQEFTYLGKGAQSYAFGSADGRFVLKFFKQQHFVLPSYQERVVLPDFLEAYREASRSRKLARRDAHIKSYCIAYEKFRDEAGLLFMQLNTGSVGPLPIALVDPLGRRHVIDLNDVQFLVQRRALLFPRCLEALLAAGEDDKARALVNEAENLVRSRCAKGIIDTDPAFLQNYGVIGNEVIQMDVGQLACDDSLVTDELQRERADHELLQLNHWCGRHFPAL